VERIYFIGIILTTKKTRFAGKIEQLEEINNVGLFIKPSVEVYQQDPKLINFYF